MSNTLRRVLVFFIGVPALIALVILVPRPAHLPFSLVAVAVSGLAALELSAFFSRKLADFRTPGVAVALLGMVIPVVTLAAALGLVPGEAVLGVIVVSVGIVLAAQVFRQREEAFSHILPNLAGNLTLIFYPGLFVSYAIRMTVLDHSSILILAFLAAVYLNDTGAYLFGNLFGKNTRNILPISPNKSVAGFIGGFAVSILALVVAQTFFPVAFPGAIWKAILLGGVVGLAAMIGDLVESALKRSATLKDSGNAIPGRGGFLDNIDSPVFAAPAFFYLYTVLFL
jgi:phosphatidate cytidylyltransferase